MEYVKQLRLNKAKILLATTSLYVAEVADKVGFSNQFHFSRQFKKMFGVSPSDYQGSLV
ncbi:MAG: helix-turn-helix transcriptional regulator [Lentisphaeria bacterium]|nr:helix-turn-helix transcriptional regulator [Lentisphaeria bacterium]